MTKKPRKTFRAWQRNSFAGSDLDCINLFFKPVMYRSQLDENCLWSCVPKSACGPSVDWTWCRARLAQANVEGGGGVAGDELDAGFHLRHSYLLTIFTFKDQCWYSEERASEGYMHLTHTHTPYLKIFLTCQSFACTNWMSWFMVRLPPVLLKYLTSRSADHSRAAWRVSKYRIETSAIEDGRRERTPSANWFWLHQAHWLLYLY